jgi:hypothetical protein
MRTRIASNAYFLSSVGGVKVLSGSAQSATQLPWPTGINQYPFTAIAVDPGGGQIAGIFAEPKGCLVYSGLLRHGASLSSREINSGACASLSWDSQGDIWVAAGTHVWMLPAGGGAAVPVFVFLPGTSPGAGPSASLPSGDTIAALRVAPDSVRVAMIIDRAGKPAEVLLGAISRSGGGKDVQKTYIGQSEPIVAIGTDVLDPTALSWYDADHVLVLGQDHGPQLYDVPLTGGASTQIVTADGTVSITTAGSELVAGTTRDQILTSSGPDPTWRQAGQGRVPAFPG